VSERREPSSYRDPAGFLFFRDGVLLRHVAPAGAADYDALLSSGLYEALALEGLLVPHEEVEPPEGHEDAHRVLRPRVIPFVSYPYEWTFGERRDAGLLTLSVQRRALERGLSLKDASAYNVQFLDGRPVFIDTLSFERYPEGRPWVAYRQFCEHFLAPLALEATGDHRLGRLFSSFPDGVPLDLASRLLPFRTKLRPGLALHLHLHSWGQGRYSSGPARPSPTVSKGRLLDLVADLEACLAGLRLPRRTSTWSDYYAGTNYSPEALESKKEFVRAALGEVRPSVVWDLGANTGLFSRLASEAGAFTVAMDGDPLASEGHYRDVVGRGERRVLPLVVDLSSPSPSLGWDGRERRSLFERGPADLALALALVHHLAIGANVPLGSIASSWARMAEWLVVEFVPKSDSQVQRMLRSREDVFPGYTADGFEAAFGREFEVCRRAGVAGSERSLYLLRRRSPA
jgi:hypothetical protein